MLIATHKKIFKFCKKQLYLKKENIKLGEGIFFFQCTGKILKYPRSQKGRKLNTVV